MADATISAMGVPAGSIRIGLLAALVLVFGVAPAFAGQPNDTPAGIHKVTSRAVDGLRVNAYDIDLGASIVGLTVPATLYDDTGDPPFVRPPDTTASNCAADVASYQSGQQVTRTLWYQIVPTMTAITFPERTEVSLDTAQTAFQGAIEVFNSPPAPWTAGDPAPGNIVACGLGPTSTAPAYVSFIALPGVTYYALVGSLTSGGTFYLNIRETDVQAPKLNVGVNSLLPGLGDVTRFTVTASDAGLLAARPADVAVTFKRLTPAASGQPLTDAGACSGADPGRGTFCKTTNANGELTGVSVGWPNVPGNGTVSVIAADRAGNVSTAGYTLHIRDRKAPTVWSVRAVPYSGARGHVTALCSEAGFMHVEIRDGNGRLRGGKSGSITLRRLSSTRFRGSWTSRRPVGHGFFTVEVQCVDQAQNKSSRFSFLYVP